jgi:antitoxin component of RelBE/YafQ-DinJ toxin-antitoxin module
MAAKKTNQNKIYVTFTVEEDVKKRFNIICATIGMNMSEVVQSMMENFIDISKTMEAMEMDRLNNNKTLDVEVEVVDSTRLKLDEDNG